MIMIARDWSHTLHVQLQLSWLGRMLSASYWLAGQHEVIFLAPKVKLAVRIRGEWSATVHVHSKSGKQIWKRTANHLAWMWQRWSQQWNVVSAFDFSRQLKEDKTTVTSICNDKSVLFYMKVFKFARQLQIDGHSILTNGQSNCNMSSPQISYFWLWCLLAIALYMPATGWVWVNDERDDRQQNSCKTLIGALTIHPN